MKLVLFLCLHICFYSPLAFAYIPPTRVILEKTVENAGTASYQIEKEVRFSNSEIPTLKETWYVENDRTMRLTVTPIMPTPPGAVLPKLTVLYINGIKHMMSGGSKETSKISDEMAEKLFHFRRTESFIQYLNQLHILNSSLSSPQGNLELSRLNRSQGVVTFGIGRAGEEGRKGVSPYVWIEQDTFTLKRIRFSENTEMTANNYQAFPKGLNYPMVVNINWTDQKVRINTLSVSMIKKFQPTIFQSAQLEDSRLFQQNLSRWNAVIEFYKRFR